MKSKLPLILAGAVLSGLVAGATAFADEDAAPGSTGSQTQKVGEKDGKKGPVKSTAKKKKMDKNSCAGKNGCGEKKMKEESPQEAPKE